MKILFLAPQPFFEERGTPINVRLVLKSLADLGHEVTLVTLPFGSDVDIPNVTIKRIPAVWGVGKPKPGPSWQKLVYDFVMIFYVFFHRLFNRYDALHCVEEAVFIGLFIKKIFGTPFVFDMDSHMTDQLRYSKFSKSETFLKLFGCLEKVTLKNSAVIVTVCQYLTDVAKQHTAHEKIFQIEDIPQKFDPPPDGVDKDSIHAELGITYDQPVALYTGNFEKYQGIDLLMESIPLIAKKLSTALFVIVGGEDKEVEAYRTRAKDDGFGNSVIFTGKKPLDHMPAYYDLADVLLSPRLEGTNTPLKIYTYLSTGKAVVATDLPTHTQLLTSDVAVLAKPEKMAFADACLLLLNDAARRDAIGGAGQEFVQSNFNYEIFTAKLKQAYESVLT